MRYGFIRGGSGTARLEAQGSVQGHGGWTVTLGDDVFVYAADDRFGAVTDAVAGQGLRLIEPEPDRRVRKSDLHLVTQVGTSFTSAHPDVPVLADAGRWLIVDVSPDDRGDLEGPDHRIEPLMAGSVVYTSSRPTAGDWVADHADLADRIDASRLQADIGHMVDFGSRHSSSEGFRRAAAWVASRLAGLGLTIEQTPVEVPGGEDSMNVVGVLAGTAADPGLVIVGAHLDSVNAVDGPDSPAPGADDNASGAAAVLELARLLAEEETDHDIAFVLYGGEEQGLHGSRGHVASMEAAERARVRGMVNMDMIGRINNDEPTVLIESSADAHALVDVLAGAAGGVTDLVVQRSTSPFGSDHVPYLDAGIHAALTIEGADRSNDAVHTAADDGTRIHIRLAERIARMNVVSVAHLAGRVAAGQPDAEEPDVEEPGVDGPGVDGPGVGTTDLGADDDCGCGPAAPDAVLPAPDTGGDVVAELRDHVDALLATYERSNAQGRATGPLLERQQAVLALRALLDHVRSP